MPTPTNLLVDPGFELRSTEWKFIQDCTIQGASIITFEPDARTGTNYAQLQGRFIGPMCSEIFQEFPVTPGVPLFFNGWYTASNLGVANKKLTIGIFGGTESDSAIVEVNESSYSPLPTLKITTTGTTMRLRFAVNKGTSGGFGIARVNLDDLFVGEDPDARSAQPARRNYRQGAIGIDQELKARTLTPLNFRKATTSPKPTTAKGIPTPKP